MTPVRLEPAALLSPVKHSTTEPLRSLVGKIIHITNTRKNIEGIAVSVVIRSVILSFNVFILYIVVEGLELHCLLKVKEVLS